MKNLSLTLFISALLFSCATDSGNEKLADASEKAGKSAATAVKSLKKGIEKVSQIKIDLNSDLVSKGLEVGKVKLDSKGGRHNVLNVYLVFNKNINKSLLMKIKTADGVELGRTKVAVKGTAGDAQYLDFIFDKRTNIDRDNIITLE